MKLIKSTVSAILAAAIVIPNAVYAEDTELFYICAYYNQDGYLTDVNRVTGAPSESELKLLLDLYAPEDTAKAKLYRWDTSLQPVDDPIIGDDSNKHDITIINTNDMHGSLVSSDSAVGVDKIAALKKMTDNSILLDAGDATQGVSFATLSEGADVIKAMNAAGYDAMALGNHEFDYGIDTLLSNIELADFPVMSANTYRDDKLLTDANTVIDVNGIDVGIFALTTTSTATSTSAENLEGITFTDEIEAAKEQVAELEGKGAEVIIALTHMGVNEKVNCTSTQLASAMKDSGLDVIIDGHSHSEVNTVQDGINIIQTGTANAKVGYVGIDVEDDGSISVNAQLLSPAFFENITPDSEVSEAVSELLEQQESTVKEVVAQSASTVWGGLINRISEARIHETSMGNLICDSMIDAVKGTLSEEYSALPVVAVENGGGFRDSFTIGDITMGDIINVLPYANTVMYKEVTPKTIYEMLEQSVSTVKSQDSETGMLTTQTAGGFLQIGGMRFEYDPNGETGSKVKGVYLDGQDKPLSRTDEATRIILVSNDYIIEGGSGYSMLGDVKLLGEAGGLAETLRNYIIKLTEDGEPLSYPISEGRITTAGEYSPKDYTAHVYIKDASDNLMINADITYYVDGEEKQGRTDENGILHPVVSDGPHAVSLDKKTEVYVNNYSGGGIVEMDGDYPIDYPTLSMAQ